MGEEIPPLFIRKIVKYFAFLKNLYEFIKSPGYST